jgi:hypothetical protein
MKSPTSNLAGSKKSSIFIENKQKNSPNLAQAKDLG